MRKSAAIGGEPRWTAKPRRIVWLRWLSTPNEYIYRGCFPVFDEVDKSGVNFEIGRHACITLPIPDPVV